MRKLLAHTGIVTALLCIGMLGPVGSRADDEQAPEMTDTGWENVAEFLPPPMANENETEDSGVTESPTAPVVPPQTPPVKPDSPPAAPQTGMVPVPLVTDKPLRAAAADVNNAGLTPVIKSVVNAERPPGIVVEQDPPAGLEVTPHSRVVLSVATTELALQPGTTVDEATGQTHVWGQLIVHRPFEIDLKAQTQNVPILAIAYEGRDYVRGDDPEPLHFAEPRTTAILENLSIAWTWLDNEGTLEVSAAGESLPPDDTPIWYLTDPLGPQYGVPEPQFPTIYLHHPSLGGRSLKILTVYPDDASAFGQPDSKRGVPTQMTPLELADYFVALIKAHHLLFHRHSTDPENYDQLDICKTKDGRIFKEIATQARQAATGDDVRDINNALEQMSLDQRTRLATLAYKAPVDWRLRNKP
jgi:hypothetical protein